ncbi:hypothetical protein NVV76_10440 [Pediococcus ethanolidurans]|uniref:hypothetical protein n=1 Tax=Pediococcus ethanolidurans TaxID=319653 RepID=UPI0021E86BE6|nr:hypothetical protein [Pediococcus ethanolidurans]MCV3328565.1 hypothetical protein [Pediococcus ethanolidurans]
MAKTLDFTDMSPRTVKIGDTTTSFTLICGNNNTETDLTNATSITAKLGNASGYLKSIKIDPASLTDSTADQVTVTFTADLMTSLPAGNYAIEVWVVDSTGTSIYPSDGSTGFTIDNNIQSTNGSTITTIAFDDFVNKFNTIAANAANAIKEQFNTLNHLLLEPRDKNIIDTTKTKNGYYDKSGFVASADWRCTTDLLAVPNSVGSMMTFTPTGSYVSFYDSDKKFLKSLPSTGDSSNWQSIVIPYGVAYITISMVVNLANTFKAAWNQSQTSVIAGVNVVDVSKMNPGYYDDKGHTDDNNWASTSYMLAIPNGITQLTAYADDNSYVTFYDKLKGFMSNVAFTGKSPTMQTQTIPVGAAFITVSIQKWSELSFTLAWGATGTQSQALYTPKIDRSMWQPTKSLVVDPGGNGDYVKVQDAINAADAGTTITIMPGDYYECVDAKDKRVNLVGYSASATRIISTNDSYYHPALEMASGSASNLSFISQRPTGMADPSYWMPYGVHLDYDGSAHQILAFENCVFRSDWNAAVGIGMRVGENLSFKNCDFNNNNPSSSIGAVFFHDCSEAEFAGDYSLTFDDCNLWAAGNYSLVALGIAYPGNKMDLTLIRNSLYSGIHGIGDDGIGKQEVSAEYPASNGDKFMGTATIVLNPRSFGNSAPKCNAAVQS